MTPALQPSLTRDQFFDRVLSLKPSIAVFDCDGTLWSGDAGSAFMRWTMQQGAPDGSPLLSAGKTAGLNARYAAYNRGEVSELAICGEMVQVYAGLPVTDIRAAAATFFRQQVENNIFPELHALITELQQQNVDIWAVSSTCDWVIEEGVRRFNIPVHRVLAAKVASPNGIASDHLLDVPTDEGKVVSLHNAGIIRPHVVFGNSVHDAAMLAIARSESGSGGAFPINPSPALVTRAAAENWPIFFPASVSPPPAS